MNSLNTSNFKSALEELNQIKDKFESIKEKNEDGMSHDQAQSYFKEVSDLRFSFTDQRIVVEEFNNTQVARLEKRLTNLGKKLEELEQNKNENTKKIEILALSIKKTKYGYQELINSIKSMNQEFDTLISGIVKKADTIYTKIEPSF